MTVCGGGKPVQAPVFNSDSASRRKAIAGRREGLVIKASRAPAQLCLNLVPVGEKQGSREGLVTKAKQGMVTGQINHPKIQMVTVEEVFNIHVTACVRA